MKTNKIKRFFKTLLCGLLLLAFSFSLSACDSPSNKLSSVYFADTSTYSLITDYNTNSCSTADFYGEDKIFRQYDSITINLSSEWLYLCTLNKIEFDITSNTNAELQFKIYVTNLKNGQIISPYDVKSQRFTAFTTLKANQPQTISIAVNDVIELAAAETCIIFELETPDVYAATNGFNDFAFSINNLALYGTHHYS